MSRKVPGGRPVAWEDAGRQIAPLLGSYHAAVVTSSDATAAAHVALGIAQAESKHRRVVIGDMCGDLPPLRSLIRDEDPHGISDSFLYGVSMNKIERPVENVPNVFIIPSGTEPQLGEAVFRSGRWKRLAAGFGEMGALLLLVCPAQADGLSDLIEQVDGAVLVKDSELSSAPGALVLARVEAPTRTLKVPLLRRAAGAAPWPRHKWLYPGLAALVVVAAAAIGLMILAGRTGVRRQVTSRAARAPAAALPPPPTAVAIADTMFIAPPANPGDSSSASAFGVLMVVANTPEGANFVLRKDSLVPAITLTPVPIGAERATWYRVIAGAYTRRNQADSLLSALRKSRLLPSDSAGTVVTAPLALLVDSVATQGGINDAVRGAVRKYRTRGLPVYALMQDDGGARLYAGAFERAAQSADLTKSLRSSGLTPVLVYRTGRAP